MLTLIELDPNSLITPLVLRKISIEKNLDHVVYNLKRKMEKVFVVYKHV